MKGTGAHNTDALWLNPLFAFVRFPIHPREMCLAASLVCVIADNGMYAKAKGSVRTKGRGLQLRSFGQVTSPSLGCFHVAGGLLPAAPDSATGAVRCGAGCAVLSHDMSAASPWLFIGGWLGH